MFVELMPLLKDRTLLLTIARVDGKVKVECYSCQSQRRRRPRLAVAN